MKKSWYIRKVCKVNLYFLRSDAYSSAWAKVTGKRCNHSDEEEMQVPSKLSLFGQPKICISLTYRINENERNLSFDIYLVILFAFSRVEISSYPKELVSGGQKMVGENECSSYSRFELTSDFYKEVLENVQGTVGNISR